MEYFLVFIVGLIFGSFANVLIWRLPQSQTPWQPIYSYCPSCKKELLKRDNIPLLGYFILRGLCRWCRSPISRRYPLVEFIMASGFCLISARLSELSFSGLCPFIFYAAFLFILVTIAFIDLETYTIPDILSLGMALVMFGGAYWNVFLGGNSGLENMARSFAGAFAGGFLFWILAVLGKKIYKQEAMGGGDIKLAAAIGAALGFESLLSIIAISSALGLIFALPQLLLGKLKRRDPIPYGPFLSIAALSVFFFKEKMPIFLKFHFPLE